MDISPIAARIKEERERLGYSYAELAKLSGVSKSTLQRYETGVTAAIPMNKLPGLARALQVSVMYLTGAQDHSEGADALREIFASLSPQNQEALLDLARGYLAAERKSKETP